MQSDTTLTMQRTLRENIENLSERSRQEAADAPLSHRIADRITAFSGSMTFVIIHLFIFGAWIAANTIGVGGVPRFDPTLVVLAMWASVEAIFLSTFVLISNNRLAESAARNADLDLHITLLTEHELTRLATLVERIADRLEIRTDDLDLDEIKHDIEAQEVLDALEQRRSDDASK